LSVPHPIPYQGSKRRLAERILALAPVGVARLVEPFAGSAAVTLAAARRGAAERFVIGDSLAPLAGLWRRIIDAPAATGRA
jgi:DNA adenine methylase